MYFNSKVTAKHFCVCETTIAYIHNILISPAKSSSDPSPPKQKKEKRKWHEIIVLNEQRK